MLDWFYAIKGVNATYDREMQSDNEISNTEIKVDTDKKLFLVETSTKAKAQRKFDFNILKNEETLDDDSFSCNTLYLDEMLKCGKKEEEIIINFNNKSDDKSPHILVNFEENKNETKKTTEKFSLFFATSSLT